MLEIKVETATGFDEETEKFVPFDVVTVRLEHSLVSVSKWESVWEKPFLGTADKTSEETISYVKLMIVNDELPPEVFDKLIKSHLSEIKEYVSASMTATKLASNSHTPSREVVTAELIYYWMISLSVPIEFQHWHLNRLITLIRVINLKNTPAKKMSLRERRELNRSRLAQYGTNG